MVVPLPGLGVEVSKMLVKVNLIRSLEKNLVMVLQTKVGQLFTF